MHRISRAAPTCLLVLLALAALTASSASAMPPGSSRLGYMFMTSTSPDNARDLFVPSGRDYFRTGADVFWDRTANVLEQFSCGPDDEGPFSAIGLSTSKDGRTWTPTRAVLRGKPGSADGLGVCDPSVVRDGAYYYAAFTGYDNRSHQVFVARATTPGGPWTTWGDNGWGAGNPAPIITSSGGSGWGVGSPSLVVLPDRLDIFYESHDGSTWQTRLRDVQIAGDLETWPRLLRDRGTVLDHPGIDSGTGCAGGAGSTDLAYEDDHARFIAVTTDETDSFPTLRTYESDDGLTFSRAVTLVAEDSATALAPHAHHAALVKNETGHLGIGWGGLIYDYGATDCPSKLRWQETALWTDPTGWVNEPLSAAAGVGHWDHTDLWRQHSTSWQAIGTVGQVSSAFLRTFETGATSVIDVDIQQDGGATSWSAIAFGQDYPSDASPHGYTLRVTPSAWLELSKGRQVVAFGRGTWTPQDGWVHVQVVVSHGTISVYTGRSGLWNGMRTARIQYADPEGGYIGGYVGLLSDGQSAFRNFTVRDDVPADYGSQDGLDDGDWKLASGSWSVRAPSAITEYLQSGGGLFLASHADPEGYTPAQLGDGAYRATVQLNPANDPRSWGGINITNGSPDPHPLSCFDGGYLVFIRNNGHVGLAEAGAQVVPDVATGLNPVTTPVRLRVVKWGGSIQVYVNDAQRPAITYWDASPPPPVGMFGLCTWSTSGVFTGVSYAGNGT